MYMNQQNNQHIRIIIPVLLLTFFACTEIDDDHGTPAFVLAGELVEISGRSLGNYSPYDKIFINEKRQETYFIENSDPNSIRSLNYETGETHKIYQNVNPNHYIALIDFIPGSNTLYIKADNYPSQELIGLNTATLKFRVIQTGYVNVAMNDEFVFVNSEYDDMFIKKIDSLGNEETLGVQGRIIFASQYTPEILVQSSNYDYYFIYNYQTESVTLEKSYYYNINQFYHREDELYYLIEYPYSIKNFKTDATVFLFPASISYFVDFNPVCWKVAYIVEKRVGNSYQYNEIINRQLIIADLATGETSIAASHFNKWISSPKIFNDGKSLLYTVNEKIYLSTIE